MNWRPVPARIFGAISEFRMIDAVMLALGIAFFAVAIAYVAACDRL